MRLQYDITSHTTGPCVAAIGTFDGVHIGHQALLIGAVRSARQAGLDAVAVTFDRHPLELLAPEAAPPYLTTARQKEHILGSLGLDVLTVLPFNEELRDLSPEGFVEGILVKGLKAQRVHVGEGFRFGRHAAGDTETLRVLGERLGFQVHVEPLVTVDGAPVSSSRIRAAVLRGDVRDAARLLGRNFSLVGTVEEGEGIGRKLGFATANLRMESRMLVPADGVYATLVTAPGLIRAGACSIGTRPTFGGQRRLVEVHVLDFDGDLYGCELEVAFVERLRDQVTYRTADELVAQMQRDVEQTRSLLCTV